MRISRAWLLLLAGAVIIVALAVWNARRPRATVEVVSPVVQTIREFIEEQAVTRLERDYLISMPISGWLEPILLREGDTVEEGQVVVRLEIEDLRDRVEQAEARIGVLETQIDEAKDHRLEQNMLIQAEASVKAFDDTVAAAAAAAEASRALVEFTDSELTRIRNLRETNSATDRELRAAELAFRQSTADLRSDELQLAALRTLAAVSYIGPKLIRDYIDRKSFTVRQHTHELAQARTQLEIERRNLARAEIRSPVDGVVLDRFQTRRQFLAGGTPLLTIGRFADLEIIAEILTERSGRIAAGDIVEIFGEALPAGPIAGRVLRVYPAGFEEISSLGVEQQRVNVAIRPDALPPGLGVAFRVYVRIFTDEARDAVTLPRTCLYRDTAGGWRIFLVRDGRLESLLVEVGIMNDDLAQITSDLPADAHVVEKPAHDLAPGTRVRTLSAR